MYLLCYSITCTDGCDPVQVTKDAKLKVTCDDDDCEDHVWYVDDQRLNSQWPVSRNRLWIIWKWKNRCCKTRKLLTAHWLKLYIDLFTEWDKELLSSCRDKAIWIETEWGAEIQCKSFHSCIGLYKRSGCQSGGDIWWYVYMNPFFDYLIELNNVAPN